MIYRCVKPCVESCKPCELSPEEYDMTMYKSTPCPIGEADYFVECDDENEFFCLIVGSRSFTDYELLKSTVDKCLSAKKGKNIIIVSGECPSGADALAKKYAKERNYMYIGMPANWDQYEKRAGFIRNTEMHKYIASKENRGVIAFWDGKSPGTAHSLELAEKYKNQIRVIRF